MPALCNSLAEARQEIRAVGGTLGFDAWFYLALLLVLLAVFLPYFCDPGIREEGLLPIHLALTIDGLGDEVPVDGLADSLQQALHALVRIDTYELPAGLLHTKPIHATVWNVIPMTRIRHWCQSPPLLFLLFAVVDGELNPLLHDVLALARIDEDVAVRLVHSYREGAVADMPLWCLNHSPSRGAAVFAAVGRADIV